MVRDNLWLKIKLEYLWVRYFPDLEKSNVVMVTFGRYAKFRFASIKYQQKSLFSKGVTLITVSSMFKSEKIPEEVVLYSLVHELAHYAHGFSSSEKKKHKHPHRGGVVDKEIELRGLGILVKSYKAWLVEYRQMIREGHGQQVSKDQQYRQMIKDGRRVTFSSFFDRLRDK